MKSSHIDWPCCFNCSIEVVGLETVWYTLCFGISPFFRLNPPAEMGNDPFVIQPGTFVWWRKGQGTGP
jgi:hypothetical protein